MTYGFVPWSRSCCGRGMRNIDSRRRAAWVFAASVVIDAAVACGPGEPRTDAERLARGRELIERMSEKLAAAQTFSVATVEVREEARPSGATEQVTLNRDTTVRRPDRFYSTVSGDRRNEVWYDGVGVTVALHNEKIFGQIRAPETLDKTLDAMHERFGVSAPFADYVYSSPAKALISQTTTGGWVGREMLDGQEADHLAFKDTGVNWEIWLPTAGDPLPLKAQAEFTENPRLRKFSMAFKNWNLAPQIAGDRFDPTVPADYEGVAIIQRARVLRNLSKDDEGGASTAADAQK
jgi:hypothetical protein